jgi:predicted nucleotidyltransferase
MSAATDERLDLLDALVYGDAFGCAVTLDELWRYSRVRVGREALRRLLDEDQVLRSVLVERDGLFCLAGRSELLARRPSRMRRARLLELRARRVARVLQHAPFVRGLVLTGSAAAGDAGEEADVDLLVIVAPERLGTAFVLLGAASRVLGRRVFCPNYYVSVSDVRVPAGGVYVARELDQARVLAGDPEALRGANSWLREIFPNLPDAPSLAVERPSSRPQALLEAVVGGRLERWARRLAVARLRAHYGTFGAAVPSEVVAAFAGGSELRFHGRGVAEAAIARYEACRADVAARLEELERGDVRSALSA